MWRPKPKPVVLNLFTLRKPDPKKMAKRNAPISSKRSAEIAAEKARGHYVEINAALKNAWPGGLDLHDLEAATGIPDNGVTSRLSEMSEMNPPLAYLHFDENFNPKIKKTKAGGIARVWFASPEGENL